jgi:choline dehydrogenase-like flavoprotein
MTPAPQPAAERQQGDVVVIGSGAGGAVTGLTLAERGLNVLMLEEGPRAQLAEYGAPSAEAMTRLYRNRGMTPILGAVPIGYVEGRCVGGSTEINSGFWHRTPPEMLLRWQARFDLQSVGDLTRHFEWAEELTGVSTYGQLWPKSTALLARGAERMGWSAQEVPRMAPGCRSTNACASGCPTRAKQGMSQSLIPAAEAAGARVLPNCRAKLLLKRGDQVTGVLAEIRDVDGHASLVRIDASHVFVCAGPTETPALLRKSGIRLNVGNSLRIHPMLKVLARFPEPVDAHKSVLPLVQVKEFGPEITLGGAFFTPGHAALTLSENWPENRAALADLGRLAAYYVAVRGTGAGRVRPSTWSDHTFMSHELGNEDIANLSDGLARLSMLLLAAGADAVFPSVFGLRPIDSERAAVRWLDDRLSADKLALTTVHAFSSCPIGERKERCAADSFGRVSGYRNLYINDSSMLPDSPGVNPQGSVMAFARRNALHFCESR